MGKNLGVYLGLGSIYLWLIYKRGQLGIISLIAANILALFINETLILKIIRVYCFLCIILIFFIDYKNESVLFRIFHISTFSQRLVKLGIILPLGFIQWYLIYFLY